MRVSVEASGITLLPRISLSITEGVELAKDAVITDTAVDAVATTVDATLLAVADNDISPFSIARSASSPLKSGMKRVQKKAIRKLRSTRRCLRMKSTMRMKKRRVAKMSMRSIQSDFSSAVMRCLEVLMSVSRTSCVDEVDWRFLVEDSDTQLRVSEGEGIC